MTFEEKYPLIPEQSRIARALLNWSLERAAAASGIHRNTIHSYEQHKGIARPSNLRRLREAFESAGVIFIDGEEPGAKKSHE